MTERERELREGMAELNAEQSTGPAPELYPQRSEGEEMNPSDSKKLEEAKKMSVAIYLELPEPVADDVSSKVRWLISKLTEQDREIARLTFQVKGLSVERTSAKQRAEKVENLLAEKEKV